jgi:hypothetical protein
MFATTFAACGTGNEPMDASTWTVLPAAAAEADVSFEVDVAGADPAWLVAAVGDVFGFAEVIPAAHAASDRLATQVVTARAMRRRYAFIGCLQ